MSKLKPTASGTLKATPMASLLVYALDKALTGTMVFESSEGGRSAVHFVDGAPTKAKTHEPVIHLGRLLLELGSIDDATLNSSLARCAKERRLHGQILIEDKAIDKTTLLDALREQTVRKVLSLFELPPRSVYGFYDGVNFLEKWGGPELVVVEPLTVIWRGIRAHENTKRIEQTVRRVSKKPLRLHPAAQLSRFCFSRREWSVLDLIRAKPQKLEDLIASGVEDEPTIKRLIYALALTRSLDLGAHATPAGVAAPDDASPRPSTHSPPSSGRRDDDATPPSLNVPAGVGANSAATAAAAAPARRSKPPLMPAAAQKRAKLSDPPSSVRQVSPPLAPAIRHAPEAPASDAALTRKGARPLQPLPPVAAAESVQRPGDSSPPSVETQSRTLRSETPDVAPRRAPPVVVVKPRSSPTAAPKPQSSAPPRSLPSAPAPMLKQPAATRPPTAAATRPPTAAATRPPTAAATRPPTAAPPAVAKRLSSLPLAPAGPVATAPPMAPKPPPLTPEAAAFIEEIRSVADSISSKNYYEILEVDQDAPSTAISAAFFRLAKKWHPDRLGPEFAEVKDLAVSVFSRMSESHQALTDEERRRQYDEVVKAGGGSAADQEAVQKVMRAITEYQKAEVLYKKRSLESAELCARRAMEDDPEQSDYVALYATIASERRGDGRMDDLIALLDGAIRREPQNERARFARARIYKRMNRMDVAIKDFRWVAEQNPNNLDAVREVRLYRMRRGSLAPGSARGDKRDTKRPGGLFGKLFKR